MQLQWQKATASSGNGNCVEVASLAWRKAAASCDSGNCVQAAPLGGGGVAVRDSKDPDGPHLHFTAEEWAAFLDGARKGEFDSL